MPDDATLLRRYAETGAEEAFAELVRRHVDGVFSSAQRRLGGDLHLAQDVTQQVFVALARKAGALSRHPVLASWLYTATRHEAANVVRAERRRKAREQEAHVMRELSSDSEPHLDWKRVAPLLDAALDALGETDRSAILLRFVEHRPFAEIGRALRLSEDAARMRVERAIEKLRAGLARRGLASTSALLTAALTQHTVLAAPPALTAAIAGSAAAAAAAPSPLAAFVSFMTASKLTTGFAGALLIAAAAGFLTSEIRARNETEGALQAAAAAGARLDTRRRELRQQAAATENSLGDARRELASAEARVARAAALPSTDPAQAGRELLARHPEARAWWEEMRRAQLRSELLPRYVALGLNARERDQLEALAIRAMTGRTTLASPGGSITLEAGKSMSDDELLAGLEELLGAERFQRFMKFKEQDRGLNLAGEFAAALSQQEPLNPDQMRIMLSAFAVAAEPSGPAIDWSRLERAAAGTLSDGQRAALERMRRRYEALATSAPGATVAPPSP